MLKEKTREQLIDELSRLQRFFDETQGVARLGGWEWEFPSGRVTWSTGIYRIYGLEPHQFDGRFETLLALTHPDDRPLLLRGKDQVLRRDEPFAVDVRIRRPDGELRYLHVTGDRFEAGAGDTYRVVGISQDITERKELEAALKTHVAELRELDRLKTDFVSSVSHEIRTPLTTIAGYVEFLEEGVGGELTPLQKQFVEQVQEGVARLKRLVDDLLDFARLNSGAFKLKPECVDASRKIEEVVKGFLPAAAGAHLTLAVVVPEEPAMLRADPQRLAQVVANLVGNALKFTPAGGTVTVRARPEGAALLCQVEDTGIGIAPEDLPRLFQRFSQLDGGARQGGLGLGLSISKALVEAHGGNMEVSSRRGEGSVFSFRLPLDPACA